VTIKSTQKADLPVEIFSASRNYASMAASYNEGRNSEVDEKCSFALKIQVSGVMLSVERDTRRRAAKLLFPSSTVNISQMRVTDTYNWHQHQSSTHCIVRRGGEEEEIFNSTLPTK
jgi:hypothetical protein